MYIQLATLKDLDEIDKLLYQVHNTHAEGRPDLFKKGIKKYTKEQVKELIQNSDTPVYVYKNTDGKILAHAFVKYENGLCKTMYIDDICVDKDARHQGICSKILADLQIIAKENNCSRITLNVYTFNENALKCYEKFGMTPYSVHLEKMI